MEAAETDGAQALALLDEAVALEDLVTIDDLTENSEAAESASEGPTCGSCSIDLLELNSSAAGATIAHAAQQFGACNVRCGCQRNCTEQFDHDEELRLHRQRWAAALTVMDR